MTTRNDTDLLTMSQVSALIRISRGTVVKWCLQGKLPAVKIGKTYRIRRGDLTRWYEHQRPA